MPSDLPKVGAPAGNEHARKDAGATASSSATKVLPSSSGYADESFDAFNDGSQGQEVGQDLSTGNEWAPKKPSDPPSLPLQSASEESSSGANALLRTESLESSDRSSRRETSRDDETFHEAAEKSHSSARSPAAGVKRKRDFVNASISLMHRLMAQQQASPAKRGAPPRQSRDSAVAETGLPASWRA